jgi:hypothetical protein
VKGLAEFVLRGRAQALLVTLAGATSIVFCWLSAAVIGLVTLRKGAVAGGWLFVWALLPAGAVWYMYGDGGPLALLAGTLTLAAVLRATVSLPLTILATVGVGVVTGIATLGLSGVYLQEMATYFAEFLGSLEQSLSEGGQQVELPRVQPGQIAGMLGAGTAMTAALCLLLARYWQAALFNPGGFGAEFRELRYPASASLVLVLATLVLSSTGPQLRAWAMICMIPLTFAGIALVHANAKARGRGTGWLAGFYLLWLIFDPVKLLVVCLAIADSWLDFRRRWAKVESEHHQPPQERDDDRDL